PRLDPASLEIRSGTEWLCRHNGRGPGIGVGEADFPQPGRRLMRHGNAGYKCRGTDAADASGAQPSRYSSNLAAQAVRFARSGRCHRHGPERARVAGATERPLHWLRAPTFTPAACPPLAGAARKLSPFALRLSKRRGVAPSLASLGWPGLHKPLGLLKARGICSSKAR